MKSINFFIFPLSLVYILHGMPMLGFRYPSVVFASIILVLFFLLLFNIRVNSFFKILPVFIIPFLDAFIGSDDLFSFFQGISGFLQSLMLPLLTIFLYQKSERKLAKYLLGLYIGVNLITCYTTYLGNLIYPGASRAMAAGPTFCTFYYSYLSLNIGGITFIYNMVFFIVLSICTIKNKKWIPNSNFMFLLAIIFLVGIVMTLIAAQYTTALLLGSVSLLLFFEKRMFNIRRVLLWGIIFLFSLFVFKPIIADGLMIIAENVESYDVSHRLTDLAYSLEGRHTQQNSDLDARGETYAKSINSFLSNPWGAWSLKAIGEHSFVFDALAKYGLLGLCLLVISFYVIYKNYIKSLRGRFIYGYAVVSFFLMIVMALVNPFAFTDILLFVLPIYDLMFGPSVNKSK